MAARTQKSCSFESRMTFPCCCSEPCCCADPCLCPAPCCCAELKPEKDQESKRVIAIAHLPVAVRRQDRLLGRTPSQEQGGAALCLETGTPRESGISYGTR